MRIHFDLPFLHFSTGPVLYVLNIYLKELTLESGEGTANPEVQFLSSIDRARLIVIGSVDLYM